eukprot:TRINITY_DN16102_c0_g1_i1.p3 TRINITY_DN16102_c0_g1~~TRINITY_DN16102_c0_g1_i1.p3  ORF type:complete len:126 (-),score=58.09 TRINITY_DN16102_c0_g1_i1:209-586(-)
MQQLENFGNLRNKFSSVADFLTIYISEAHPTEQELEWENYNLRQHQSMDEKIEAARVLRKEGKEFLEGCPILVDNIDNEAEKKYSGLPERLYVILDGEIIYAGEMGPFGYSIKEVDQCLSKLELK